MFSLLLVVLEAYPIRRTTFVFSETTGEKIGEAFSDSLRIR